MARKKKAYGWWNKCWLDLILEIPATDFSPKKAVVTPGFYIIYSYVFSISLPRCSSSSLSAALIYIKRHSLQSLSSCIIISSFVLYSCFCRLLSLGAILLSISCFVGKGRGPERAQIADREGAKLSCGHTGHTVIHNWPYRLQPSTTGLAITQFHG